MCNFLTWSHNYNLHYPLWILCSVVPGYRFPVKHLWSIIVKCSYKASQQRKLLCSVFTGWQEGGTDPEEAYSCFHPRSHSTRLLLWRWPSCHQAVNTKQLHECRPRHFVCRLSCLSTFHSISLPMSAVIMWSILQRVLLLNIKLMSTFTAMIWLFTIYMTIWWRWVLQVLRFSLQLHMSQI